MIYANNAYGSVAYGGSAATSQSNFTNLTVKVSRPLLRTKKRAPVRLVTKRPR